MMGCLMPWSDLDMETVWKGDNHLGRLGCFPLICLRANHTWIVGIAKELLLVENNNNQVQSSFQIV